MPQHIGAIVARLTWHVVQHMEAAAEARRCGDHAAAAAEVAAAELALRLSLSGEASQ
jgi:hypothetical protein